MQRSNLQNKILSVIAYRTRQCYSSGVMASISRCETDTLFSTGITLHFKKGSVIIRSDEPPQSIYKLEKGFVKVYSLTEKGDQKIQIIHKPHELFPLIYALRGIHKKYFYQAMNTIIVSKVSCQTFRKFVRSHVGVKYEISQLITDLYDTTLDRIDNLEIIHTYPRLISDLLYSAKRFGIFMGKKVYIPVPFTHEEIAASLGISRETVSREIEHLIQKKLLKYTDHCIVLPDINRLNQEFSTCTYQK